jgi:hypothetical protein
MGRVPLVKRVGEGFRVRARIETDRRPRFGAISLAAVAALAVVAAACGGTSKSTSSTSTSSATAFPFKATFTAPNHRPVVNKNWHIKVTVKNLAGRPIAATLHMQVVFQGSVVGQIDNGKVYHFVGTHHENIVWPRQSVGYRLTFQSVIKAKGKTKKINWWIKVRT